MTYELAKELKDAGLTQNFNGHSYFCSKTKSIRSTNPDRLYLPDDIAIPTLSELIKACGRKFFGLRHAQLQKGWYADARKIYSPAYRGKKIVTTQFGKTPEEAVARLWLALNKK